MSIIAKNKPHAHHKTHAVAYNEKSQTLIFFWPLSSVDLFQGNQGFQVIEFLDWHVSEKL